MITKLIFQIRKFSLNHILLLISEWELYYLSFIILISMSAILTN